MDFDISSFCTRAGLILDCLAFFFVTPELLGERRLCILQRILRRTFLWVSLGLLITGILVLILIATYYLFLPVLLSLSPVMWFTIQIMLFLLYISIYNINFDNPLLVGHVLLFLMGGLGALSSWSANKLMGAIVYLCNKEQARQSLMKLGVIVFVLGALLQLLGTFQ